ncbi:hypothetical protein Taro_001548 [Colocasia esculenta]|uniref:30S ribosomal protein S16, chloroplastic n=1 Tax=Colocasia esculenta TaxID=4460 RepID=A0A843TI88_COLES|nr:hypothetical protein [Colocasia esculenta]
MPNLWRNASAKPVKPITYLIRVRLTRTGRSLARDTKPQSMSTSQSRSHGRKVQLTLHVKSQATVETNQTPPPVDHTVTGQCLAPLEILARNTLEVRPLPQNTLKPPEFSQFTPNPPRAPTEIAPRHDVSSCDLAMPLVP